MVWQEGVLPERSERFSAREIMYAKPSSLLDSVAPNVLVADCGGLLGGYHGLECTDQIRRMQRITPNGCIFGDCSLLAVTLRDLAS